MKRRLAAAAVAVLVGCAEPQLWEEKGFDSKADCWSFYGWDRSLSDGANTNYDHWCGPR